jgi:hypothetical protein
MTRGSKTVLVPGVALDGESACGGSRRLRDFTECSETWARLAAEAPAGGGQPPDNLPRMPATLAAYQRLTAEVLDPVEARFGPLTLTYGFAGPGLFKKIGKHIDPSIDQHAGCELNGAGNPICKRGGAAVDFVCPGVSSAQVAEWIASTLPFDRLYFYGGDRPLHVSVGPDETRQAVSMLPGPSGRRVPKVLRRGAPFPG